MDYLVRFTASATDLDAAYALRREVFEREQGVPRPLDRDAHDFSADHVVVLDLAGACVGTGRVVRVDSRTCQVGRQATSREHRGRGVGALVLEALERISALRGVSELTVHSQLPAERFYRSHGFARVGNVFEDQGVPHVLMRKVLVRVVTEEPPTPARQPAVSSAGAPRPAPAPARPKAAAKPKAKAKAKPAAQARSAPKRPAPTRKAVRKPARKTPRRGAR